MNEVKSFATYIEYYELITLLSQKEQEELTLAIWKYMFEDITPTLNDRQQKVFNNLKRPLDISKNKSKSARKDNQEEIILNSNENQIEIKTKSKQNQIEINKGNTSKMYMSMSNVNVDVLEKEEYEEEKPSTNKTVNDLFKEYLALRKKNKLSNSNTVIKRLINKLEPHEDNLKIQMLENAINGNWKDVYPIDGKKITPDWFNKDIEVKPLSKEKKQQMEEMLKDFK